MKRTIDAFSLCHPAVNFLYFTAVIAGTVTFQHPVFLGVSFLCACVYSILRNGVKSAVFDLCLLPVVVVFAVYYSSYHHFGITVLYQNFLDNNMTWESFVYGLVMGVTAAGVMVWFSCVFSVFTTDKVVYLFGRISPRLSLFLAILLRMVPRIKKEARRIHMAQRGIGRGMDQGNLFHRIRNTLRIFSAIVTWTIESLVCVSESMQSRGSTLRGRTAFSIYRFDSRDRAFVISLVTCLTLILMAVMLGQTDIVYDPQILMSPVTAMSYLFYVGYTVFCLLPPGLDVWTEYRFRRSRRGIG